MRVEADRGRGSSWLAVTVRLGGRPRTFAPRSRSSVALLAGFLTLAAWYLGATLYFVFHDRLLAALIARQTAAQYAYEDRIAGLGMQLDQQVSRALLDRRTLETTVRDLEVRSARLAARAAVVERLVAQTSGTPEGLGPATADRSRSAVARNPLLGHQARLPGATTAFAAPEASNAAGEGLGLDASSLRHGDGAAEAPPQNAPARDDHAEAEAPLLVGPATVMALASAERDQDRALTSLREPALHALAKIRTALAQVGVAPGLAARSDVGGPFVPLAGAAVTFDQDVALLQDALQQTERLKTMVDRVPLRQPVEGVLEVTSSFGPRLDPFYGRAALHTGLDLREAYGTPVHATAAGVVSIAAAEGGYGTMVEVNHGGGFATRYAHLANASVAAGQRIEVGAVIGHVGSSGRATGPHLHYETRVNGEPVDPVRYLKAGARLFEPS